LHLFHYICKVEKICQHIEKLLAQHDYVVVPNLGGFVVQMQSAVFFADRITPPLATIGFNPLLHHSDGLLAIEIARTEGISYRTAMEFMDKEVEKIKIQLNTSDSVLFGNMGFLRKTVEGHILFLPNAKAEFLPANFGLFNLPVSHRNVELILERRKVTITLPSARTFKYAVASMFIFGMLLISPQVNDMRQTGYAGLSTKSFGNIPEIKEIHTIATNIATEITPLTTAEVVTEEISAVELNTFHVVVASLGDRKTAEKFCQELTTDKYAQAHVLPPSKTYRVAIQSFANRKEAIQYMENLRKSDKRFETAWVMCK